MVDMGLSSPSLMKRIGCWISLMAVYSGGLLGLAFITVAITLLYMAGPTLMGWADTVLGTTSGMAIDMSPLKTVSLGLLGLLAAIVAAYAIASVWITLLVLVAVLAPGYLLMWVMVADVTQLFPAWGVMAVLGAFALIVFDVTGFHFPRYREHSPNYAIYKTEVRVIMESLKADAVYLVTVAFVLMICTLAAYGLKGLPIFNDQTGEILGGVTFLLTIIFAVLVVVARLGWHFLDAVHYAQQGYVQRRIALMVASLGPILGAGLAAYYTHDLLMTGAGFVFGFVSYTFLGPIFTCNENLFQFVSRKKAERRRKIVVSADGDVDYDND